MSVQVLCHRSRNVGGTAATSYSSFPDGAETHTTEAEVATIWATAGVFENLVINLSVAPGAGKSWTFTLRVNGVDSALVVTISDTATTGRDITNSVTVATGDELTFKVVPASTPTTPGQQGLLVTVDFDGTTAKQSGYAWAPQVVSASATRWHGVFENGSTWNATSGALVESVVAAAGDVTAMFLNNGLGTQGGGSKTYTVHIYKNGVKQDGTGGTVDTGVAIAGTATSANGTFTLPVVAGDTLYVECVPTNTPSAMGLGCGFRFVATTDGQSNFCGFSLNTTANNATRYSGPEGEASVPWNATEANVLAYAGVTAFSLSKLRVKLQGDPGSGKSYTFDARANSTSPVNTTTVTIADSATTGSDATGNTTAYVDGSTLSIRSVPSGTPTARAVAWAMIQTTGGPTYTTICDPGAYLITGTAMDSLTVGTGLAIALNFVAIQKLIEKEERRGLKLDLSLGGTWSCTAPIYDTDIATVPVLDDSLQVHYHSQRIFKGNIVTVGNRPRAATKTAHITHCLAKANRVSTDQVEVTKDYAAGQTLQAIVTDLFNTYIAPNFAGYVLDPTMLAGPTITDSVSFVATRLQAAWNRLMNITGWIIRITPNDVLESFEPGTKTSPYGLTAANLKALGALTWEQSRANFVNRVNVRYGTGLHEVIDNFTGDGVTTSFTLSAALVSWRGYVTHVVNETLGFVGDPAPPTWFYDTATNAISRPTGAPANAVAISITYDAQYPATVTVEDAASIAAVGLFERTFTEPAIFDAAEATALADGYLRIGMSDPQVITARTKQYPMPLPGDVINLDFPTRGIPDDDYLITRIQAEDYKRDALEFTLTCVSGTELVQRWMEILRDRVN